MTKKIATKMRRKILSCSSWRKERQKILKQQKIAFSERKKSNKKVNEKKAREIGPVHFSLVLFTEMERS